MLRIKIEIVPYGVEEGVTVLHTFYVGNDGKGNRSIGHYDVPDARNPAGLRRGFKALSWNGGGICPTRSRSSNRDTRRRIVPERIAVTRSQGLSNSDWYLAELRGSFESLRGAD
jgi:hypothetical protein